ncbi:MAG: PD40 domain-containing protein [Candidatus Eisenbacteria bacterium]|nr:PD40 domain-containing protein [Candidatus Eisenbacteria bacterium]
MRLACAALTAFLLVTAMPRAGDAQAFGQNKVQYERLEWAVLETPHLRLHYYAREESLARALVAFAESVTVEYDRRFAMKPRRKVPLLLYSTHHLFQQTNATPEMLTESVGGLTELIKGRVLVPHNGSWARLRWVTRHELAHAYMLEKFSQVMKAHRKPPGWLPPLWYIEGLAEYCGTTWDADAEGLLRDLVVSRLALPLTRSDAITGSVLMYKEGQSFLLWLAARHGDRGVFELLDNAWRAEDFETCFRLTYGRELAEADEEWFETLRRRYLPAVASRDRPSDIARPFRQDSRFNLGARALPAPASPDTATRFCWFEVNDGAVDLMLSEPEPNGGRRTRRLLRSGGTPMFESFHLFQNRPGVSRSGLVAVSAQQGGRDAILVLDPRSGDVRRELRFPELVSIHDPSPAPGDSAIVFTAQDYGGRSDLWRASWHDDDVKLERLTNDDFDDLDPATSPDGAWVAFASDRCDEGGRYALYRLSLAGGAPERLSFSGRGDDRQPAWSRDGRWLAFRSTRDGSSDLWLRSATPSREARRLTRLLGPASDPDWTWDGRSLLFTAQDAVTFHTWQLPVHPESLDVEAEDPGPAVAVLPTVSHSEPAERYQRRLGLDLVQNMIGTNSSFGYTQSFGQVAISDLLGNEQIVLTLANDSEHFGDFWDGFEGGVTYLNQAQRLNYGLGVFRLTSLYDPDFEVLRREKRIGLVALASYPFSRFERVDASLEVRHASDHLLRSGEAPTVDLVSNYVSFVHDNSRWTWSGPIGGTRLNLTAGFTRDMAGGRSDYGTLYGELRHYRQPLPGVVTAWRANGWASFSRDAHLRYLGGPTRLRVPDARYASGLQTIVLQHETRFPVLRGLVLSIPSPWQLPTVSGVAFGDAAWTFNHGDERRIGVAGWGVYLAGGYWPAIRWNWMWVTEDWRRFRNRAPYHEFFIAYNF